jgi:8-oxo-dGTP pyrophosphatase MutT (NUDIX family)
MPELYQLYDEQGRQLVGQTTTKDEARAKGLLHGSSHVWMWRKNAADASIDIEVLLQKRSPSMQTWPDHFDISAAGHLNPGEDPVAAALRETQEEIGLDLTPNDLQVIHTYKAYIIFQDMIENEFQFVYLVELEPKDLDFTLQAGEVGSLVWRDFNDFKREVLDPDTTHYVPHGDAYYEAVIKAIEQAIATAR